MLWARRLAGLSLVRARLSPGRVRGCAWWTSLLLTRPGKPQLPKPKRVSSPKAQVNGNQRGARFDRLNRLCLRPMVMATVKDKRQMASATFMGKTRIRL